MILEINNGWVELFLAVDQKFNQGLPSYFASDTIQVKLSSYFTLEAKFPVSGSFNEDINDEESSARIKSAFTTIPFVEVVVAVVPVAVPVVASSLGAPKSSDVVLFPWFKSSSSSSWRPSSSPLTPSSWISSTSSSSGLITSASFSSSGFSSGTTISSTSWSFSS